MGTGASSYNGSSDEDEYANGYHEDGKTPLYLVRSDSVAPIIIKNCREEYQHISSFQGPIKYGSLSENIPEHPLIQGQYCIVRDPVLPRKEMSRLGHCVAPNIYQSEGIPVFMSGQPTIQELEGLLEQLFMGGFSDVYLFNLREEPVLFVKTGKEFQPYSIRTCNKPHECVVIGKTPKEADFDEARIRKEVIDLAAITDENKFFFYNDLENLDHEPHVLPVEFEDHLLVSEEVYGRPAFSNPNIKYSRIDYVNIKAIHRYQRLCFPLHSSPSVQDVDLFITVFKESPAFFQDNTNPAMLFTCQMGFGRSTVGLVMGHLLCAYQQKNHRFLNSGIDKRQKLVSPRKPNYERGEFRAVQKLVHVISEGEHVKFQVDTILDQCSMLCELRTDILTTKLHLEGITTDHIIEGQNAHRFLYKRCLDYLDRYFFLICFSAYVRDQFSAMLSMSFSKWLHTQPDIIRLWSRLSLPVSDTSQQLLNEGKHVLVTDEYIGLDMLSSQGDLHVSNFRKISTKGISVYGMAQPARKGFAHVVNHLLCKKVKHNYVVLINLRNDIAIESDSTTYSVRSATNLEEPIIFPGFSHSELEEREENLKKLLSAHSKFQVYKDLSQPPEMEHQFTSVFCISELADQQKLQTLDMTYKRVPLQCDSAVEEKDFENIMSMVCEYCQQEKMKSDNWDPAFVFFCRTGKSRTTLAMAIAGLILCHYKGFPKGACVGEQARISLPNAQYTNGDFIIVQKLVRILPKGQQMKREVDCILDEVFDTMTPMHFHLREIIFVTYNKIRKSRTEDERQMLQKLSIDYLERYIYLIIFNTYLHFDYNIQWKRPFSHWMKQVAAKSGVYELLDNLGFYDFELPLETFRTMSGRWKARVPEMQFQGEFL